MGKKMGCNMKKVIKFMAYLLSILFNDKILKANYIFACSFIWYVKKRNFKYVGKNVFVGLNSRIVNPQNITIGDNFCAEDNFRIEALTDYLTYTYEPKILVGNNVFFGNRCRLGCINEITIDDNCLIGSNVYITDHFHGEINKYELNIVAGERKLWSKGPVFIGKNCWIGDNVCIMPNVKIGDNVIVGANSVVTKDVPANSVVVGAPARIIKTLI